MKKLKKFFLLLAACLSLSGYVHAQDNRPQVFSPNAAELGKYGRIPVTYFNGLPNISVPLTELKARGYTLPIYLSYHASGNKPDQHPGWVGLGWSLHAGGCINRVVNGMKDEMNRWEYQYMFGLGLRHDPGYYYHREYMQQSNWMDAQVVTEGYSSGEFNYCDLEPDEFQVCIDDIQASFYLTENGGIKIVSKSAADFKVEIRVAKGENHSIVIYPGPYANQDIGTAKRYDYFDQIKLTNSDGTVYVFGGSDDAIEYSMPLTPEYVGTTITNNWRCFAQANTWLLTRIERPDGEVITFTYTKDGTPIVRQDVHHSEFCAYKDYNRLLVAADYDTKEDPYYKKNISFSLIKPSYLESIHCSTDSLSFSRERTTELEYATTRDEFEKRAGNYSRMWAGEYYYTYDQIKAEDYYMQLSGITGPNRNIRLSYTSDPSRRLTLQQVSFRMGEDTADHQYSFDYDAERLPSYHARLSDLWGFYNGISYNGTTYKKLEQVRKQVNPSKAKAEILTAIHYPTGGWTEFEYEGHDYSKEVTQLNVYLEDKNTTLAAGGLRIKEIRDYSVSGKPETRTFSYLSSSGQSSGILAGSPTLYAGGDVSRTMSMEGFPNSNGATWVQEGIYELASENPIRPLSTTDGNHVTYSQVKETLPDGSYSVYRYTNHDYPLCCDTRPTWRNSFTNQLILFNTFNSRELFRGLLLQKTDYSAGNKQVRDEKNEYVIDTTQCINTINIERACGNYIRRDSYRKVFSAFPYLKRKTVSLYPDEGVNPSVEKTDYTYNSHRQVASIVRSDGSNNETVRMTYSGDMPDNKYPYGDMKAAGIFDRPVQKTVLRGIPIVSSSLTTYRKINTPSGDQFVPDKYYESRLSSPIPAHLNTWTTYSGELTADLQTFFGAPMITFDSYDAYGNILSATDEGGRCTRYCWDLQGWNPEASFSGMMKSVQSVQTESIASREIDFHGMGFEEYTFEFDAGYTGEFSFVMSWPNCVDYSIRGYLDGQSVFIHRKEAISGGEGTPRRAPRVNPDIDPLPDLIPATELYNGTVTAGHHVFRVVRVGERVPESSSNWEQVSFFLDGKGSISYPIYRTEQHSDNQGTWYYSFEANGNQEGGFNSDKAWHGSKKFTQTIPSDVPYTIDWMEQGSNGKWAYKSSAFTGTKTLGSSTKSIDNVRIYPTAATATNWTWTPTGELRSVTDGSGITASYVYDGMGRLTTVLDTDGKKVSSYEYHYTLPSATTPDSYVKTRQYTNASGSSATVTINYHDGLGRPWQTISVKAGKTNAGTATRNLCVRTDYDASGRPYKTWLPFRTTGVAPQTAANPSESIYSDSEAFSYVEYDGSPLDRPVAEYGPGKKWHTNGRAVRYEYKTNGSAALLNVTNYRINSAQDTTVTVQRSGKHAYRSLSVKSVKDEDGLALLTFTDIFGRTVLERRHPASGEDLDTYYVYDAMGRLAAVLPPALSNIAESTSATRLNSADIDKYAYLYTYDANGNCTAKKLPGCGWTRYIYDKGNRPVFSQDAENRRMGRWMFSFSDIQGRSCVSGYCEGDMETLKQAASATNVVATRQGNANGPYMGYSVSGLSLTNPVVLSASYYDDYGFIDSQVPSDKRSLMNYSAEYGLTKWNYVHGLQTGSAERILGELVTNDFRWSACYYDKKGNLIQARTTRKDGGVDVTTTAVTFTGKPDRVHISHDSGRSSELNEYYKYTYDSWERPLTVTHRMGESADSTVLSDIKYDGIGRVVSDDRNGVPAMKTSFTYNVRSWNKSITGPGLSEVISYEDNGQWGGNISKIRWSAGTGSEEFQDAYSYDGLSRLINSTRLMSSDPSHKYINVYDYDENSNIKNSSYKEQTGSQGIIKKSISKDFTLNGNRLVSGTTTTGTNSQQAAYAYDLNGRLTLSGDQGMTKIQYNAVGYPSYIKMADNSQVGNTYTSGGTRLNSRKTAANGVLTVMAYEGNEVFENGKLRMLQFDGGYVDFSGDEPRYCWYTKDHLGSVRAVADAEGHVFSTYAYGPYGEDFAAENLAETTLGELGPITYDGVIPNLDHMSVYPGEMSQYSGISGSINGNGGSGSPTVTYSANASSNWQPYKFSGKESLTRVGLDLYDFGARMYSPSNMRWMTMDPLAERSYHISPYVYCSGDPINRIDPDGMFDGKKVWRGVGLTLTGIGITAYSGGVLAGTDGIAAAFGYSALLFDGIGTIVAGIEQIAEGCATDPSASGENQFQVDSPFGITAQTLDLALGNENNELYKAYDTFRTVYGFGSSAMGVGRALETGSYTATQFIQDMNNGIQMGITIDNAVNDVRNNNTGNNNTGANGSPNAKPNAKTRTSTTPVNNGGANNNTDTENRRKNETNIDRFGCTFFN